MFNLIIIGFKLIRAEAMGSFKVRMGSSFFCLIFLATICRCDFARFVDEDEELASRMREKNLLEYESEEAVEARAAWVKR